MSPKTKDYILVFLLCTTLGGAAMVVHTRQQLADALQAPSLKVTRSEFNTSAAPAPIVAAPAAEVPALAAEVPAERPEGAPGEAQGPGNRGPRGGGFGAQIATLMQDAEFAEAWKIQQQARIEQRYGELFKQLNLPPEKLAALKELMIERENAGRDVFATAAQQGLDPRDPAAREQLRKLSDDLRAEVDSTISSTVGPQVISAIETYNATAPQRNAVNNLSQNIASSGQPLNAYQTQQLTRIITETATVSGRNNVTLTDATISQAAGFLSSSQLETLKQQQAVQQANQVIEEKTRALREAAGGGGGGGGNWRNRN